MISDSMQAGESHTYVSSSGFDKNNNVSKNDNGTEDENGDDDQRSEASTSISEYSSSSASIYSQHTPRSAEKRKSKEKRRKERRKNERWERSQRPDNRRFDRCPLSPAIPAGEDRAVKKRIAKYVEMGEETAEQMTRHDDDDHNCFNEGKMRKQGQQDKDNTPSIVNVADQNIKSAVLYNSVQLQPELAERQEARDMRYSVQRHGWPYQMRQKQRYSQYFDHVTQYTYTNLPQSGFASGRGDHHKPGILLLKSHHKATPITGKLNVNAQSFTPSSPIKTILKMEK